MSSEKQLDTGTGYRVSPIQVLDGIPVFSEVDKYIKNYQKIAADHVAAIKPGHANPFIENKLWLELEESTRRLIVKHVPAGSRILDVGVGLGRVLQPLRQYKRFGIDISMDYLVRAKESGIEVAFSRIEDMPYADGFFDAVMASDVLEHVLDLNFCCKEILRVLKPGGVLIARVPYREDLSAYLSEDLPYEYVHLRNFDEFSLQLLFEKILECRVLEFDEVAPYLQGPPRMKLRQLPVDSPLYELIGKIRGSMGKAVEPGAEVAAAPGAGSLTIPPTPSLLRRVLGSRRRECNSAMRTAEPVQLPALQAPSGADPKASNEHPLSVLMRAMEVSQDEFTNWIYKLREEHPDWYEAIIAHVAYGLEINVVVLKPAS